MNFVEHKYNYLLVRYSGHTSKATNLVINRLNFPSPLSAKPILSKLKFQDLIAKFPKIDDSKLLLKLYPVHVMITSLG